MPTLAQVRDMVFSLSDEEQLALARELCNRSNDRVSWEADEILAEAERREREMDATGDVGLPFEDVMTRLRTRHAG